MGRLSSKHHQWTNVEDEALISALIEICQAGWKRDNNIFRSGYTTALEHELKSKLPGCNLKASPHIESRLKTLKKRCDAKGLRNKPLPYYEELCMIFGKHRDNRDVETYEASGYAGRVSKNEQFTVSENENREFDREEFNGHKGDDNMAADDDDSHDNDDVLVDDGTNDNEEANNHKGDDDSNDDVNVSTDDANKKGKSSDLASRTQGLVKIIEALIKKQDEQFSVLVGIVGLDVAKDKAAAEKRAKLNGELKKIPNLSLQARLRAASVIVCDAAKLDLFYSLPDEERKEWVSMLLSGLL